jgi:hypothetical protein
MYRFGAACTDMCKVVLCETVLGKTVMYKTVRPMNRRRPG